jgi:hypothetical protein
LAQLVAEVGFGDVKGCAEEEHADPRAFKEEVELVALDVGQLFYGWNWGGFAIVMVLLELLLGCMVPNPLKRKLLFECFDFSTKYFLILFKKSRPLLSSKCWA